MFINNNFILSTSSYNNWIIHVYVTFIILLRYKKRLYLKTSVKQLTEVCVMRLKSLSFLARLSLIRRQLKKFVNKIEAEYNNFYMQKFYDLVTKKFWTNLFLSLMPSIFFINKINSYLLQFNDKLRLSKLKLLTNITN